MGSRSLNVAILLFWLSTMTWLMVVKVLPPLRTGDPPNYQSILASRATVPPICWSILVNDRPLGWAASKTQQRQDGLVYMHSRVFFRELPIEELAPGWFGAVVRPLLTGRRPLDMEAISRLDIDPLGRLVGFESRVRIAEIKNALTMQGELEGSHLKVKVESGDFIYRTERYLAPDTMIGDALSPQTRLPGLRLGQKWTMPVYSPFRPPRSPMEILEAKVERSEKIAWDNEMVDTLVVFYRADSGSGPAASHETRARLWVRRDGMVLKQEMTLFNSRLYFERLSDRQSALLAANLAEDWSQELPRYESARMFSRLFNHIR